MRSRARAREAIIRICVLAVIGGFTACGFFPIIHTSEKGTESLAHAPKPPPVDSSFDGCGEAGAQPDYTLSRLKNRVDTGEYLPVQWKTIARLPWPHLVGYRFRHQWMETETRSVARFEGAAVRVDGYLAGFRLEIPEPPNCYSTSARHRDYHMWLSDGPHQSSTRSIVVELTPRVRVFHPGWTDERLDALVGSQVPVRVRGWLMLDQMHPESVGLTRITLWEVHPVMDVQWRSKSGQWISLDKAAPPNP